MKKNQKTQAFTLIELIVVITILAILWTIAFISLQWYSVSARDSKRVSDISNIKKSLELFSLNTWKFPEPDDYNTVSYSWELIWYQWIVWDQVSTNLSRNLNEKPTDPLTGEEYIYSTINSQTEYEILWLYESDIIWMTSPQPSSFKGEGVAQMFSQQSYAKIRDFVKVEGNFNWLYARTSSFYIPTPSIINWNVWWNVDFAEDETLIESQVVTGGDNIPWESTWWLNIRLSPYEWTITNNSTEEEKVEFVEAIQNAYSWTVLVNDTVYADVLSKTSTWEMVDFVDVVVLEIAEFSTFSSNGWWNSSWEWESWWEEWWETTWTWEWSLTSTDCMNAWWFWVDYKIDLIWDWYCISPRIEWWEDYHFTWNDLWAMWLRSPSHYLWYPANANSTYWITYDLWTYSCKELGTATGSYDIDDTIVWRMKWLANNKTNTGSFLDVDWVNVGSIPKYDFTNVPAIMLADCIDWERDLSDTNIYEWVTFDEYSNPTNDDSWRIKMNKYLLGWTKEIWSHLPSAFADISKEWENELLTSMWEYQMACENNSTIWWDLTTDQGNGTVFLSAVTFNEYGTYWGRSCRSIGNTNCWLQYSADAGVAGRKLRFVVRPPLSTSYSCDMTTAPVDNGHINYVTWNPKEVNQAYIRYASDCGYTCKTWYGWKNCNEVLTWWRALDPYCDIDDIVLWTQTWAWCNSTLWEWFERWQINSDIWTNNYSWLLDSLNNYGSTEDLSYTNAFWTKEMMSFSKANDWFSWISLYWDSEYNAIWWKLYTYGTMDTACPSWRHVPTTNEWKALEIYLNWWACRTTETHGCDWLWWKWHESKTDTNNLANSLKIPLSGYRNHQSNRFKWRGYASSHWTSQKYVYSLLYDYSTVALVDSYTSLYNLGASVRCIKD